ncbi:MAG: hypothetical protein OXE46_15930 [Chloroflexi bacterium]|nr:hypothetical protein [Chloroflexota bacterium]
MAITISSYLSIDSSLLEDTGAYNGFVDQDTKVFVDPRLLKTTRAPELQDSYASVRKHFAGIVKLLAKSQNYSDIFWRQAKRNLRFNEERGLCIGYASESTAGSGIGSMLQTQLLTTAKIIIDAGIIDPEMFELLGLFEEGIGADRISDMIANIIMPNLLAYSERIFKELGIDSVYRKVHNGKEYWLPSGPTSGIPIILVPTDVLNELPVAHSYEDIPRVVRFNEDLRAHLNGLIGDVWGNRPPPKSAYKRAILRDPSILAELIKIYRRMNPEPYDFEVDPLGLRSWYDQAKQFVTDYPLALALPANPTANDVIKVVQKICQHFKQLVENNGLYKLLYRDRACRNPKHEEAAQALFFGVADGYCRANNLDLSPESNSGRGPVDFKISAGYRNRILIELKLSSNKRLVHGFAVQLQEYQKAEHTEHSIFLVIDVGGCTKQRWAEFSNVYSDAKSSGEPVPTLIRVDGKRKPPASKV